jgi:excinuclease ABC subunit A
LIDRLAPDPASDRARVAEAVARGFERGGLALVPAEGGAPEEIREGFACEVCGRRHPEPEPALFSFNHARGACETCAGFGRMPALDLERVVPDPSRTLASRHSAVLDAGRRPASATCCAPASASGVPTPSPGRRSTTKQLRFVVGATAASGTACGATSSGSKAAATRCRRAS